MATVPKLLRPPQARETSHSRTASTCGNVVCFALLMNNQSPQTFNFLGHPLHQMLVVFPAGLLISSVLVDVAWLVGVLDTPALAQNLLGLGLLGGLVAAPFGWHDWRRIPLGTRARRVGAIHGIGNSIALLLFFAHWLLRNQGDTPSWAVGLSLIAGACMAGTAWLGAELVTRLGVGVHVGAHLDAPNSLRGPIRAAAADPEKSE